MASDCIFCGIASGEIPAQNIVYSDKNVVALVDIRPVTRGHVVVVPKKHSRNMLDMESGDLCEAMRVTQKLARAVKDAVGAGGVNIHINNEPPAGQVIMHPHIHIIPRFSDDGLEMWKGKEASEQEMHEYAELIKGAIGKEAEA